jgi:pSer/pThr/pTyr-binding forkhead associated (FHA) protein
VPTQKFDPSMLPTLPGSSPAPAPARASRVVRLRGAAGEFALKEGVHTVGRQESCAVAVLDRQVSRTHAILALTPTSLSIEDKGSANGTFVNGKRVSGTSPLRHGDTLSFGGVEFTVELQG